MSIFAHQPTAFEMSGGDVSQSVAVEFKNGSKTLSLALDNSLGRMPKLGRGDIRLFAGEQDVTARFFGLVRADEPVHASIENFDKALKWLRQVSWGLDGQRAT
jgi:hypothetical protein